jgi:hypothetical protein
MIIWSFGKETEEVNVSFFPEKRDIFLTVRLREISRTEISFNFPLVCGTNFILHILHT